MKTRGRPSKRPPSCFVVYLYMYLLLSEGTVEVYISLIVIAAGNVLLGIDLNTDIVGLTQLEGLLLHLGDLDLLARLDRLDLLKAAVGLGGHGDRIILNSIYLRYFNGAGSLSLDPLKLDLVAVDGGKALRRGPVGDRNTVISG